MAKHVKVINKGSKTYTDTYNGKRIEIPVNGFIKMQRREAIQFLSQMSPADDHDRSRPKEKNLVMEAYEIKNEVSKEEDEKKFICNLDGKSFDTQEALDAHLKTLSDKVVDKDSSGNIRRKVA